MLLAFNPRGSGDETVPLLLLEATTAPDSDALLRVWKLARVLEVDDVFLDQLAAPAKLRLAELLAKRLLSAVDYLDFESDAKLDWFAERRAETPLNNLVRSGRLPPSRLTALLHADDLLSNMGHTSITDYFAAVADAYASIAEPLALGNVLRELPPGRPAYTAEGAFSLLQLPQTLRDSLGRTVDLSEEWLEVQRLGREQLILDSSKARAGSFRRMGNLDPSLPSPFGLRMRPTTCGAWAASARGIATPPSRGARRKGSARTTKTRIEPFRRRSRDAFSRAVRAPDRAAKPR